MGLEWCLDKLCSLLRRRSEIFLRRRGRIQIGKIGGGENGPRVSEPANCRASTSSSQNACDEVQSKGTVRRKGLASAVSHPPTQIG
jgi:hypothetical protein